MLTDFMSWCVVLFWRQFPHAVHQLGGNFKRMRFPRSFTRPVEPRKDRWWQHETVAARVIE